jgi:hypothetical protein
LFRLGLGNAQHDGRQPSTEAPFSAPGSKEHRKESGMKYLYTNPVSIVCAMFGAICAAIITWPAYRPEIQQAIRTAQELLFWWQQ